MALLILRAIESAGLSGKSAEIVVTVPSGVDLYLLNQKRTHIVLLEKRYAMSVMIQRDDSLIPPDYRLDTLVDREDVSKPDLIVPAVIDVQAESKPVRTPVVERESGAAEDQNGEEEGKNRSHLRQRRSPFQNRRRNKGEFRSDRPQDESQNLTPVKTETSLPDQPSKETQAVDGAPDSGTEKAPHREGSARRNNRRRGNRSDKKNREGQVQSTEEQVVQAVEKETQASAPEASENEQTSSQKSERDPRRNRRPRPRRDASKDRPSEPRDSAVESKPSEKEGEKTKEAKAEPRKEDKPSSGGGEKAEKPKSSPFLAPQPILDPTGLMFSDDKPVKKKKKGFWSRLLEV